VPPDLAADPPVLRLEAGGPTAPVSALAFSPDGRTLYAAGFDKVVRTWRVDKEGRWDLQDTAYRVPIGPGSAGVINAVAVSPDNKWLAAGGLGVVAEESRYADQGRIFRIRPLQAETDRGVIWIFPTEAPGGAGAPAARRLVGHLGPVAALAFAPGADGGSPVLVSAAREPGLAPGLASATSSGGVRAWDADRGTLLGQCTVGELYRDTVSKSYRDAKPPALAVRRIGPGPKQLRVAIAWDDGFLRVWDVTDTEPRAVKDGLPLGNNTAVYTPAGELVTGGFEAGNGYLRTWSDGPGQDIKRGAAKPFKFDRFEYLSPLGLAAVPDRDGRAGQLAILLRVKPKDAPRAFYNLGLVSAADRRLVATAPLWNEASSRPVLAASADGRYLAVAGADQPTVRVYEVTNLLAGREDHQTLHSVGVPVRRVAFAVKAGTPLPGLVLGLSDPPGAAGDELLFDFVNRALVRDPGRRGWKVAAPPEDGWKVTGFSRRDPGGPWLIDWQRPQGRGEQSAVRLDVAEDVTAAAVVPPIKDVTPAPLLAVAAWDRVSSRPLLALYDTRADGPDRPLHQVRQFSGHARPVRSLAVTPDGRFLASAAEDQTVSVWSLIDLADVIGKHAALLGVDLADTRKGLVVDQVDPAGPAAEALHKGDVITGLALREGQKKPSTGLTALAFSDKVWDLEPGRPIWVTVRGQPEAIRLETGQGIDDRKPLLSLFLADLGGTAPEWIAWTTSGPYDASSKKIEDFVGWHFNPKRDRPRDPATFAELKSYSQAFYEPKLLQPLLTRGDLRGALEELDRPPAPKVEITAPRPATADGGPVLVRDPLVPLALNIDGPSLEKGQVKSVVVEVDGRPERLDLATARGQRLSKDVRLPEAGEHTVRVTVRTTDDQPAVQELRVIYQPPPPHILVPDLPEKAAVVGQASYPLHAQVVRGRPGLDVNVLLFRLGGAKPKPLQLAPGEITDVPDKDLLDIKKDLKLQPGENAFRLEAVNTEALAGHGAAETDTYTFVIKFEKQATPRVVFTEVDLDGAPDGAKKPAIEPGQLLTVHRPRVHLRGAVMATAGLSQVELRGMGDKPVVLKPEGKMYNLDREVGPLEPGREYTLTLAARTPTSDEGTATLRLQYEPELAEVEVVAPRAGEVFAEGQDRAGPPEIEVKGALRLPAEFYPFDVAIQVLNGKDTVPQGEGNRDEIVSHFAKEGDTGGGEPVTLGRVRLRHGVNRIQVWVRMSIRDQARKGPIAERSVSFVRPPFILNPSAALADKKLAVHAEINSPAEVPVDHVVINGREYSLAGARATTDKRKVTTWVFDQVIEYPQGKKTIALSVANEDDRTEAALTVPRLPGPGDLKVEIDGPVNVREPSCTLHVKVKSLTKLEKLRLLREGQEVARLDVTKQVEDAALTNYEWQDDIVVNDLKPGVNRLRVEAVSEQTQNGADHTVTYAVPPIRLVLEKPKGVVPQATYILKGKVEWHDAGQAKQVEENLKRLRVYVNGFRQLPPAHIERGEQGHTFSVELRLNGPKNRIQVECPGLPSQEPAFEVACADPEKPGRLHLLIVNAGKNNVTEQDLVRRAFAALKLPRPKGPDLHSDVFREVIPYPSSPDAPKEIRPLVGYAARKQTVSFWLDAINASVRRKNSPNDVVLIYWLGEEAADINGDWYLKTSDTASHPKAPLSDTGVRIKDLVTQDDDVLGARVVFLDVVSGQRADGPRGFDWSRSDAAVLGYAWPRNVPIVPGMLLALEKAAGPKHPEVSLEAAAAAARALHEDQRLQLPAPIENLARLGQLILAARPSAQGP
jgi:WD40 repeat protein